MPSVIVPLTLIVPVPVRISLPTLPALLVDSAIALVAPAVVLAA